MELIIFDVDGTLVYSDRRDSRCFAQTFEQLYSRPFPSLDWSKFPHVTDTIILDTVLQQYFQRSAAPAEVAVFQKQYMERLREQRRRSPHLFCEVPGAGRAIAALEAEEERLIGVGTGGWQQPAFLKLGHVGIKINEHLFTGADGKVEREAILQQTIDRAEEINGGPISRVIYIGDAIWDVATTANMQIDFVGVRRRGDVELLQQAGAKEVIVDYRDQQRFAKALQGAQPPAASALNGPQHP